MFSFPTQHQVVASLTPTQQKDNDDGFGKSAAVHAEYVKFLAKQAASLDLAMGLKNALDLIPDVVDVIQFAVNEQCHEFSECDAYKPFTEQGKAVFNIEYNGQCDPVDGVVMMTVTKSLDLSSLGGQCNAGAGTPTTPTTPTKGAQPVEPSKPGSTQPAPVQPSKSATPSASATPSKPAPSSTVPAEGEDDEDNNENEDEDEEGGDDEAEEEDYDDEEGEMAWPHHRHRYHGGRHNSTRTQEE